MTVSSVLDIRLSLLSSPLPFLSLSPSLSRIMHIGGSQLTGCEQLYGEVSVAWQGMEPNSAQHPRGTEACQLLYE